MAREYTGDVRDLSYNGTYARPHGQTASDIRDDARYQDVMDQTAFKHIPKPNRYYLLLHLGLTKHAERLLQ